jgi:hypothetical protein
MSLTEESLDTDPPRRRWPTAMAAVGLAVEAVVIVWLAVTLPHPQPRDIDGTATCASGAPVVGVWIEGFSGGSGFATLTGTDGPATRFAYHLPDGGQYQVRVGCGGTPGDWHATDVSSYSDDGFRALVCEDSREAGRDGTCR